MRSIRSLIVGALVLVVATAGRSVQAQTLSDALAQMRSDDETVRMKGFSEVFALANVGRPPAASLRPGAEHLAQLSRRRPEVATALIALLERENAEVRRGTGRQLGESYSVDYYGNLIGSVAALRDPRAAHALLGAITTGGMATDGLAALGDAAAPEVLQAAGSSNHFTQLSATVVLSKMATSPATTLTPANRSAVRARLLSTLQDSNFSLRMIGLRGMAGFSDDEAVTAVRTLAAKDPYFVRREGRDFYPVRELAVETVRKQAALRANAR